MSANPTLAHNVPLISIRTLIRDLYELTKPRITFLMLVTTFTGMWLANKGMPALDLTLFTLLGVGLASASSCAFNNFIDRDIDKTMLRTQNRPLPQGRLEPWVALMLGLSFGMLSVIVLAARVNALTAGLALATNFFYVVIYTIWLKRTTPLNTDLGGIPGAMPAVMGVTAVANGMPLVGWALFIFMVLWQPPHFWALALVKVEEYRKAGIPMLPVVKGEAVTKRHMLIYTITLIPASVALTLIGSTGWIYFATAFILSSVYLGLTIHFIKQPFTAKLSYRLFLFSILYLCILFVMMFVDAVPA